jgi:hypothetical protein
MCIRFLEQQTSGDSKERKHDYDTDRPLKR